MNLNKSAVIVVSDLHSNSTVSVCPPRIQLDDGGHYQPSRIQRALWESLNDFPEQAKRMTEGMTRLVLFNGDMGELDTKRRSTQLISQNKATIISIVLDTIAPLVEMADRFGKGIPFLTAAVFLGIGIWASIRLSSELSKTRKLASVPAGGAGNNNR